MKERSNKSTRRVHTSAEANIAYESNDKKSFIKKSLNGDDDV